jgi:hypothetical protein
LVGVDPAAQTILAGGRVPAYIGRHADEELQESIAAGLDGRGPWLIVAIGSSKVGAVRSAAAVCAG